MIIYNLGKIVFCEGKIVFKILLVRVEILIMRMRCIVGLREVIRFKRVRVRSIGWEVVVRGIVVMGMVLSLMMKECRVMI